MQWDKTILLHSCEIVLNISVLLVFVWPESWVSAGQSWWQLTSVSLLSVFPAQSSPPQSLGPQTQGRGTRMQETSCQSPVSHCSMTPLLRPCVMSHMVFEYEYCIILCGSWSTNEQFFLSLFSPKVKPEGKIEKDKRVHAEKREKTLFMISFLPWMTFFSSPAWPFLPDSEKYKVLYQDRYLKPILWLTQEGQFHWLWPNCCWCRHVQDGSRVQERAHSKEHLDIQAHHVDTWFTWGPVDFGPDIAEKKLKIGAKVFAQCHTKKLLFTFSHS